MTRTLSFRLIRQLASNHSAVNLTLNRPVSQCHAKVSTMPQKDKILKFTGPIAPVFTPFKTYATINPNQVEPYAKKLARNGVNGVFLFGTTGEGFSLSIDEKIQLTKEWVAARTAVHPNLLIIVVVSATNGAESCRLAQECARLGVDAIALQPPLYYKPTNMEDLASYIAIIANHLPDMPMMYYHIPPFVGDWVDIVELVEKTAAKVPSFVGLKYSSFDVVTAVRLDRLLRTKLAGRPLKIICGYDQALCSLGAGLGVNSGICASFNLDGYGELYKSMLAALAKGDLATAQRLQDPITDCVEEAAKHPQGFFPGLRERFNKESVAELILIGKCRMPIDFSSARFYTGDE